MRPPQILTVLAAFTAGLTLTGGFAAEQPASAAAATPTETFFVPASIDSTGKADVTAELNAFLQSVPDSSVVQFKSQGQYRIEGTVQLVDKNQIVVAGNDATLFATTSGTRERAHLSIVGGQDLEVRDLNIRGAHDNAGAEGDFVVSREAQHGIQLHGPQRVWVHDTKVSDVYGDFVYLGRDLRSKAATYRQPARDITIEENEFTRAGRQGIALTNTSRVLIAHNEIGDVRRTIFDLEPNAKDWLVEDVTISENSVGESRLNFLSAGGNGPVNNVRVAHNILTGKPMNSMVKSPEGVSRRNWTYVGNVSDKSFGSPLVGVVVGKGIEGFSFRDNVQPMHPRRNMVGLRLENSCGVDVGGNSLVNAVAQSTGGEQPCTTAGTSANVLLPAKVDLTLTGGFAAEQPASAAAATPTETFFVPASIDSTGKADVTAELNAFLQSVPDSSVVQFKSQGQYRIEGTVQLVDKNQIVVAGNDATLFATTSGTRERAHLSIVGGQDLEVRDLNIRGAHDNAGAEGDFVVSREAQHGIQLHGPQRVWVHDTKVSDVYGDFVYLGRDLRSKAATYRQPARDITIEENEFTRAGRQGIALTNTSRVLIAHNEIGDVRRTIFDLEPNAKDWLVEDVTISENSVGESRLNFLSAGGNGPVNNVRVAHNILTGKPMNSMVKSPEGVSRRNWTYVGNVSDKSFGSPLVGVVVGKGIEGFSFRDNVQPMHPRRNMVGLRLENSCGVDVGGNSLVNAVAQSTGGEQPCTTAGTSANVLLPAKVNAAG